MNSNQDHENIRGAIVDAQYVQIASVFTNEKDARESVNELVKTTNISREQLTVIKPNDNEFSEKLEGDSRALGKLMWHSHLILGAAGLFVGAVVAFFLVSYGPAMTQQNPFWTYLALISPGLFTGLFVAGLLSLRPDRNLIIEKVKSAIKQNRFAIVVNLRKNQSGKEVLHVLRKHSIDSVEAIQ